MKKRTQKIASYTLNQLNKIASGTRGVVLIEYDNTIYTLTNFQVLKPGEDYYDPEDEAYEGSNGLVAYVEEMPEHIPWNAISRVLVASEVNVK